MNENFENKITDSNIQYNNAAEYGGGIMSTNSNFSFYNTSFLENQAMIGGGIYYSEFKPYGVYSLNSSDNGNIFNNYGTVYGNNLGSTLRYV